MTKNAFILPDRSTPRSIRISLSRILTGLAMAAAFQPLGAADLTWSGGTDNLWNTSSTNWNNNTENWNSSTPDNAFFSEPPTYLVLLADDLVAGTITVTDAGYGLYSAAGSPDATLSFERIIVDVSGNPWGAVGLGGMEFTITGSNGVTGRVFVNEDSFDRIGILNLNADSALSGGVVTVTGGSVVNANEEGAIRGGEQNFTNESSLNAGVAYAVAGGTQTFEDASSLNASAASGLSSGSQTFSGSSSLNASVAQAVTGGAQSFHDSSTYNATATSAIWGGEANFYDSSSLIADAEGAIDGGDQYFEGMSSLIVNAENAIIGGNQSFSGMSRLVVNVANGISERTVTLTEEAGISVQADDALSSSVTVEFDSTSGGTGGFLILNGYDTSVGAIISQTSGAGVIENRGLSPATLTVDFDDVTVGFDGVIQDGFGAAALAINKSGSGRWHISGDNTYTGGTTVSEGILRTGSVSALGTGPVTLAGGTLEPLGALTVSDLEWNSGRVRMNLYDLATFNIQNSLTNGGGVQTFDITGIELLDLGDSVTLLNFGSTNFTSEDFAAFAPTLVSNVSRVMQFVVTDNSVDLVIVALLASGPVLQNSAPVGIPVTADFTVEGSVSTGAPDESNAIRSLTFLPGSSLQVFQNLTVTDGLFDVPEGVATITGGNVIVPGTFEKYGAGLLNFVSDAQVSGPVNVNSGALLVNGNFTAGGGLTVFQNALLGGNGIINGDVLNNGIVSPGNSPGTLTINGNYTQSTSGALLIEIANPSVYDRLVVSGNASLSGTLAVLASNLKYGQQYAFLQAGSISGEFDQILVPEPDLFRGRFLVEGGTGTLVIAPTSYTLVAETTNQRNVAKALDSYIPASGNDRETVSIALDLLSAEQYPDAFDQIAPSFHESLANITIEQAFAMTQQINQRLSAVRLGARGFQAIGIESPLVHDKDGKSVADAKDLKSSVEAVADTRWSTWVMGNGLFGRVTNVSQVPNYKFNSGGFLVGVDYSWSENFTTGLYGGYQYTYADYNNAGNTQINSALFGGYATYDVGGFYADAVVGGGYNGYRARRGIEFSTVDRTARSQPNGGQFNAALNLGYDWEVGKFTFGPIAGVQYTYAGIAPFTETGADSLDLRVAQQNANSLRTTFGGRVAYTWNITETIALIPEVRMFWQHEFLNNPRNISSALDGGSGPTFGYETSAPARDSVFAGAGVSAQFGQNWNAFFFYNADFGRQDYTGHMVSGGVSWKF